MRLASDHARELSLATSGRPGVWARKQAGGRADGRVNGQAGRREGSQWPASGSRADKWAGIPASARSQRSIGMFGTPLWLSLHLVMENHTPLTIDEQSETNSEVRGIGVGHETCQTKPPCQWIDVLLTSKNRRRNQGLGLLHLRVLRLGPLTHRLGDNVKKNRCGWHWDLQKSKRVVEQTVCGEAVVMAAQRMWIWGTREISLLHPVHPISKLMHGPTDCFRRQPTKTNGFPTYAKAVPILPICAE